MKIARVMVAGIWMLADALVDTIAPLVGLGAAAGVDRGYANAVDRAIVTVGKIGFLVVAIPYDIATKGGIFLDNQFLKYALATFGDVVSNLAREPGTTLVALASGYLLAKIIAKLSSHYRKRWVGRPPAVMRAVPH